MHQSALISTRSYGAVPTGLEDPCSYTRSRGRQQQAGRSGDPGPAPLMSGHHAMPCYAMEIGGCDAFQVSGRQLPRRQAGLGPPVVFDCTARRPRNQGVI